MSGHFQNGLLWPPLRSTSVVGRTDLRSSDLSGVRSLSGHVRSLSQRLKRAWKQLKSKPSRVREATLARSSPDGAIPFPTALTGSLAHERGRVVGITLSR